MRRGVDCGERPVRGAVSQIADSGAINVLETASLGLVSVKQNANSKAAGKSGKASKNQARPTGKGTASKQVGNGKQRLVVLTEEDSPKAGGLDTDTGMEDAEYDYVAGDSEAAEYGYVTGEAVGDEVDAGHKDVSTKVVHEAEYGSAEQWESEKEKKAKRTKKTKKPASGSKQEPAAQGDESPVLTIRLPPMKAVPANRTKKAAQANQEPAPKRKSPRNHS